MNKITVPIVRIAKINDLPYIIKLLADDQLGVDREHYSEEVAEEYYSAFKTITNDKNNYLIVLEYEKNCWNITIDYSATFNS